MSTKSELCDPQDGSSITIEGATYIPTQTPGADLWPAGDPVPGDREWVVTFRKVETDDSE